MIRRDPSCTIALVNGDEPVALKASGELAVKEALDDAWFRRRVLEMMYDVARLNERVKELEAARGA